MKSRAAKFLAAVIASMISSANLLATAEPAADKCLTSPGESAPAGSRWRYRVERGTGRHCWFLKGGAEKAASTSSEPAAAADDEAAPPPPPRKKPATPRSVSNARAEFAQTPAGQDTRPVPLPNAPAASAPAIDSNRAAAGRNPNMLAPAAATRWPDPMTAVNTPAPAAPAAAPEQSADSRSPSSGPADQNAPARAAPAAKPQPMPRAVPPMPESEKPMSLAMLITVIAGGLSVLGLLVSMLFAWRNSRLARLTPSAPMPPLEMPDQPLRPGDLYRERMRLRAQGGRHAA
jgi:hypothetical protein